MKVLLSGEGVTELGDWAIEAPHRSSPPRRGVLEALLRRVLESADICDGVVWKDIPKYRVGNHRRPEHRNVLGLALRASEARCVLVFSRDRDRKPERQNTIEDAIAEASAMFPSVRMAGGVAVEAIEAWVLAIRGDRNAESHADPKSKLSAAGCVGTQQMVDEIENAEESALRSSLAPSLVTWLDHVDALAADPT
jgi:hypothetical protein